MKYQYLRAFIVLVAGLVTLIVNMKTKKDITVSLFIVLVVIICFYFLGTLIVEILQRAMENGGKSIEVNPIEDASVTEEDASSENASLVEEDDVTEQNAPYSFEDDEL